MARTSSVSRKGSVPLSEVLDPKERRAMASFGKRNLDEMVRFAPRRYTTPAPIGLLGTAEEGDEVSAIVRVEGVKDRRMRSRSGHLLEVRVSDGLDELTLTFFLMKPHLLQWHRSRLPVGRRIVVHGIVRTNERTKEPQITHPRYEEFVDTPEGLAEAERPLPVYPLRKNISQATMRSATAKGVECVEFLDPPIPQELLDAHQMPPLADAVAGLHTPLVEDDIKGARWYFGYEEAFVLQTIFAQRRARDEQLPAPALRAAGPLQPALVERLPFDLTAGQVATREEISERVGRDHPTSVLLQGDVGSGKTVVALQAMLRAVDSGYQAVLLAPTEVLAEQHFRTITELMGALARAGRLDAAPDATKVRLLTGSQRTAERRETLLDATSGEAGILVGTHALLGDNVEFQALGLVVVDEQHRFGVDHRRTIRAKGRDGMTPHMIVMTATPIPRTAALTTVGDLDLLTLRERPGMRAGVESYVVPEDRAPWLERMWTRAAEEIAQGRQVFVVCPRIEEDLADDDLGDDDQPVQEPAADGEESAPAPPPRGVLETAELLGRRPELDGARIGVLHGRLPADEKQEVMDDVVAGRIDLLVATTVIEVGVDVPNATVMIILDAERFGVSQLHQLRGRVGRGEHAGIAFLDTRAPSGSETSEHLELVAGAGDGFDLADLDLGRRGAGDLVGDAQSGLRRTLEFLDVIKHRDLIEHARTEAAELIARDPELAEHRALAVAVEARLADSDVERS